MLLGEQEIRRSFLKKIKLAKTKPHKQGTLNGAKMLERRIQHHTRVFVFATMKPILKYPTKYKLLFKLIDTFIYFSLNIALINTTNLS